MHKAADSYFTPAEREKITKLLDNLDRFLKELEQPFHCSPATKKGETSIIYISS